VPQAPWRAARTPAKGRGRAVAKQESTRGWGRAGELAGGEPVRPINPATEETEEAEQGGGRTQGGRRGGELTCGLNCDFRESQGLYCKGLVTFKPMLKWRWSKNQKCMVFQTLQLLFKVHLQLSNSF
jgi:hypothetical protein